MAGDVGTIIDGLRPVLEPSPAVGFVLDDTLARPPHVLPNTLYAWPRSEAFVEDGTGRLDRHTFVLRVAVGFLNQGEQDGVDEARSRAVSLAIQTKVAQYRTNIRDHRARDDELWSDLQVTSVNYDDVSGFLTRGFLMEIAGWSFAE